MLKQLTIRDVLRSGYNNPDYNNTDFMQLIANQKSKIFNFSYGIDPTIKEDFEKMFLLHYFNYSLAFVEGETSLLGWQICLAQRLCNIFPLYNQFITKMKQELTGANSTIYTRNYTDKGTLKENYTDNEKAKNTQDVTAETGATANDTEDNIVRDFPNSAITNPATHMTGSNTQNVSRETNSNSTSNLNGSNDVDKTGQRSNDTSKIGDENTERTEGISDLEFIRIFRNELTGLYDEIFKYCIDLFIFVF